MYLALLYETKTVFTINEYILPNINRAFLQSKIFLYVQTNTWIYLLINNAYLRSEPYVMKYHRKLLEII